MAFVFAIAASGEGGKPTRSGGRALRDGALRDGALRDGARSEDASLRSDRRARPTRAKSKNGGSWMAAWRGDPGRATLDR